MNDDALKNQEQLKQVLNKFPELKLAFLFGSFATGRQNSDSDLDIAVASGEVLSVNRKMQLITELAQSTKRPIDLIDLQMKQEPIFSQVITNGSLILCRDRGLYAEFIKLAIYNVADFLPLRARILDERRKKWLNS